MSDQGSYDVDAIPAEMAPGVIHVLGLAMHCVLHHYEPHIESNGMEWLVSICAHNCACHFEIICREEPERWTNHEWFSDVFCAFWDGAAKVEFVGNGMSLTTAGKTYRVFTEVSEDE